MKIFAVNGSPRGKDGNTSVLVDAFLRGAQLAGAETIQVFLAEKEIRHCKGCFSCWMNTPGQCVIQDDMAGILKQGAGADVFVLATPLYFDNISGMLKVFMDRSIVMGDPRFEKDEQGESRHVQPTNISSPKLMLISNCGFPERSHFQVISHWINRAALNMRTEVIGEIYATQGGFLRSRQSPELLPIIDNYLHVLVQAGEEIVTLGHVKEETEKRLAQNFIPDEIYIREANKSIMERLNKSESN